MPHHTIARELIETTCDTAAIDRDEITNTYSGRGMYGERCFGVTVAPRAMPRFLVTLGSTLTDLAHQRNQPGPTELATDLAFAATTDSMGREVIVYFPGWALTDTD